MKKLKYMMAIFVTFIAILTGCGNSKDTMTIDDPSQMPGIVFMFVQYIYGEDGYQFLKIGFYDRNGQYYTSHKQEVGSMRLAELIRAYEAGELEDKIKRSETTCDVDELFANYQKLCEVSKNEDLKIVYLLEVPAVVTDTTDWYGIYYDEEGELQELRIHRKDYGLDFDTNDEQANEIYEWYKGTFQKETDSQPQYSNSAHT